MLHGASCINSGADTEQQNFICISEITICSFDHLLQSVYQTVIETEDKNDTDTAFNSLIETKFLVLARCRGAEEGSVVKRKYEIYKIFS